MDLKIWAKFAISLDYNTSQAIALDEIKTDILTDITEIIKFSTHRASFKELL